MGEATTPTPRRARARPGIATRRIGVHHVACLARRDAIALGESVAQVQDERTRAERATPVPVVVWIGTAAPGAAQNERGPGDLVIDLVSVAATMSDEDLPQVRHVALAAVAGAIHAASRLRERCRPHVVHADATPRQVLRYLAKGYAVHLAGVWPIPQRLPAPDPTPRTWHGAPTPNTCGATPLGGP